MITEDDARKRAEAAAAEVFSDNLLGKVASREAVEVTTRALLKYAKDQKAA